MYMIEKAAPTTAIAITLHPDAYARLADDAEIVAALEAQPLISLVSAWRNQRVKIAEYRVQMTDFKDFWTKEQKNKRNISAI